ncbi:MAG: glutathione S-transferase, partial [Gammaproteobacteria bacterium]|nr:glutathione S-transferase [Gammaproteobacteria bacterium]
DAMSIETDPELQNRQELLARAGRVSIPYLVDPNTGQEMGESDRIIAYLNETYARK